jgi:TorA maturation chaperone TorD
LEDHLGTLAGARLAFYVFLNVHFMELPGEEFVHLLRKKEFLFVLEELGENDTVHPEIIKGASLMRAYLSNTAACTDAEVAVRLGVDRTRLYRGISPDYGLPPPYECLWTGKSKDPRMLQDMARIYHEGGFTLQADAEERLDYIGIQLSYLERLVMKEIAARESGDEGTVRVAMDCERRFIRDHVSLWVPNFVSSALDHAQTDFYRGHLYMLRGFIEQEKEVLGITLIQM